MRLLNHNAPDSPSLESKGIEGAVTEERTMSGNKNSGRRPSLDTLLGDAGMASRLVLEQIHAAATAYNEQGKRLLAVHQEAREQQQIIDEAINALRRERIGWDGVPRRKSDNLVAVMQAAAEAETAAWAPGRVAA